MTTSFPKLLRLDKAPAPDCYGLGDTPIGTIMLAWQGAAVVTVKIIPAHGEDHIPELLSDLGWNAPLQCDDKRAHQLVENVLFPDRRWTGRFNDVTVGLYATDFQWAVLQAMAHIPASQTLSYNALGAQAGKVRAARAVGTICARNTVPLIIPCHRVLASNGGMGGYGYGVALKAQLLAWEQQLA